MVSEASRQAQHQGDFEMFAQSNEGLKRMVVGGLGATLFGMTCLLAAAGPAQAVQPVQTAAITQPATLQS
jgi:hypothetical protein